MRTVLEILGVCIVFYVAVRIGMHARRRIDAAALLKPQEKCAVCGSNMMWEGKLIHYTDCKTGLG
jgi:hypothetical protein